MKNYIIYILILLLNVSILCGTFGINIFTHLCGKSGVSNISLFNAQQCQCEISENQTTTSEVHSCCNNIQNQSSSSSIKSLNCCVDTFETRAINESFLATTINHVISEVALTFHLSEKINFPNYDNYNYELEIKRLKQKLRFFKDISLRFFYLLEYTNSDDKPEEKVA